MQETERHFIETVLRYYGIIKHRIWLIVGVTGGATLAVLLFAVVSIRLPPDKSPLPNTYTAEAILFVSPNEQSDISDSILSALGVIQQNSSEASFSNGDLILEILRSRTILDSLVREFGINARYKIAESEKTKAREILLRNFTFVYARNTGSLRISYTDADPAFAKNLVNRTVELLSDWFVRNRGMAKEKMKQTLGEKLAEVKSYIDTLQTRLKDLQQRYGVLNAEELSASQAKSLADLRSQLIMKEIEIKNYSTYSRIDDPRLEQLNAELQNLRELISRSQTTFPNTSADETRPRNIADVAQQFTQLTNELDIQQRIYNTLSPQYEAAKLSPESAPIFEVFELAELPSVKTGPKRATLVMKVFAGSLFLGLALALALDLGADWKAKCLQVKEEGERKRGTMRA